jgi:uncharacterized lipoprotein YehR (DUF1307 family)
MNHLKQYARDVDGLTHFLTYADNNAVGYFTKQVRMFAVLVSNISGYLGCIADNSVLDIVTMTILLRCLGGGDY